MESKSVRGSERRRASRDFNSNWDFFFSLSIIICYYYYCWMYVNGLFTDETLSFFQFCLCLNCEKLVLNLKRKPTKSVIPLVVCLPKKNKKSKLCFFNAI